MTANLEKQPSPKPSLVDLLKDASTLKDAFELFKGKTIFVLDLTHHKNDFKLLAAKSDYAIALDSVAGFSFSPVDEIILPYGAAVAYKLLSDK